MEKNPLIGLSKLEFFTIENEGGSIEYPFGLNSRGYIRYFPDNYFFVEICDLNRRVPHNINNLKATAANVLVAKYEANCGTYEIKNSTVCHQLKISVFPQKQDTTRPREFTVDEQNLILSGKVITATQPKQMFTAKWNCFNSKKSFSNRLLGQWRLMTYEYYAENILKKPYGDNPLGLLRFDENNFMFLEIAKRARPFPQNPPYYKNVEALSMLNGYNSFSGFERSLLIRFMNIK